MKTVVIHKELFDCSSKWFFVNNIKFFVIVFIDYVIGNLLSPYFILSNIFTWFLSFAVYTLVNAVVIFGIYYLLKEASFISRVKGLVKRGG